MAIVSAFIAAGLSELFIVGSVGIWPYITVGNISPLFLAVRTVGVVIGILIGSILLLKVRSEVLRWIIAFIMLGSGIKLLQAGIYSLRMFS